MPLYLKQSTAGGQAGIPNDAVVARFSILSTGQATIKISVQALNPTATYIGYFTFESEAVPTP